MPRSRVLDCLRITATAAGIGGCLLAQAERVLPPEPPTVRPTQPQRPRAAQMTVVEGVEADSDQSFEVSVSPTGGVHPGDNAATRDAPAEQLGNPYRLAFVSGEHAPPSGERLDPLLERVMRSAPLSKAKRTFGFVMLQGRITAAKLARVRALGVTLHKFHTFQSYSATIPFASIPALLRSPDVRWVGHARPEQKIDPELRGTPEAKTIEMFVTVFDSDVSANAAQRKVATGMTSSNDPAAAVLDAFTTIPNGPFQRALQRDGAEIIGYDDNLRVFAVRAKASAKQKFAAHDFVHYVELVGRTQTTDDRSTRMIGADALRGQPTSNGTGISVGIIDTGVHNSHLDLRKLLVGWDYLSSGGPFNDTSGHGTHVFGTMAGTGAAQRRFRGVAPGIGTRNPNYSFVAKAIPGSSTAVMNAIAVMGRSIGRHPRPQIINNSWALSGTSSIGWPGTDTVSIAIDDNTFRNRQLHVFAAGNSGGAFGRDVMRSVLRPAVAKNALTVASQHNWKGTHLLERNSVRTSTTGAAARNFDYLLQVAASSTTPRLTVTGFRLHLRASTPTTVSTYLYRADSAGRPASTPSATGTMSVGTTPRWCTTRLNRKSFFFGSSKFFIGFRTHPSVSITQPVATSGTREPWFFKSGASSSWIGPNNVFAKYYVDCETHVGETVDSSAKGPTRDGRLKPNIAAPGRWITSTRTKTTNGYTTLSGTSMAAPHVTGAAAAIAQGWASRFTYNPSNMKAWLTVNSVPFGGYRSTSSALHNSIHRQGLGQVDMSKLLSRLPRPGGWDSINGVTNVTSTTNYAYLDVDVPSDATHGFVVMNWDEPPASTGALRAALADLDLHLDIAPFQSGGNTGEFSSRALWDTWEYYEILGSMSTMRGKKLRIKINPRVRPATGITLPVAVSIVLYRGSTVPRGSIAMSAPTAVRPNQTFELKTTVNVPSTQQTNAVLELLPSGFSVSRKRSTTLENDVISFPTSPSVFGDSLFNTVLGNLGSWYSPTHRTVTWDMRRSTPGNHRVCVDLYSDNWLFRSSSVKVAQQCKTICVDGTAPRPITGLTSTPQVPNVWSNNRNITLRWNPAADSGCAGIAGYATTFSFDAPRTPTSRNLGSVTSQNATLSASPRGVYYSIRAVDHAGNFGPTATRGPFRIDDVLPVVSSVTVNDGDAWTNDLNVKVGVTASDTLSGVKDVTYSANRTTWLTYQPFANTRTVNIRSLGAGSGQGTKTVWVRVRDRAGNRSALVADSINYDAIAPIVRSVQIDGGASFTRSLRVKVRATATDDYSGLVEMRYSANGTTWGPWFPFTNTDRAIDLLAIGGNRDQGVKAVSVQVRDRAGNLSALVTDKIVYDTVAPTITSFRLAGGNAFTSSLTIPADVAASDANEIRYSNDGRTWSPWSAYSTRISVDLGSFGGSSATGVKRTYVQARDGAGNVSAPVNDTIRYYLVPTLRSATPATVTVINETRIRLTGSGLGDVSRVLFGPSVITSTSEFDWARGYFRRVNDTQIDIYSPQGLAAGLHDVRVANPGFTSTRIQITVVHNTTRRLGTAPETRSTGSLEVLVHRGDMPAATLDLLTLSLSATPLRIPGLIDLDHGGNASTLIDPSFFLLSLPITHDPVTRVARLAFPLPAPASTRLYLQAVMIDPANPDRRPIPVSTMDSTIFR